MLYIRRDLEQDLKEWYISKTRKPLLLFGARQVGKTTLVKQFAKSYKLKLVYINFEDIRTKQALANVNSVRDFLLFLADKGYIKLPSLTEGIDSPEVKRALNNVLVFLDEVQEAPHILSLLRFIKEDLPELAVIATGSWLNIFLTESKNGKVMQFPVGRVDMLTLYPITFLEYLRAAKPNMYDLVIDAYTQKKLEDFVTSAVHSWLNEGFLKYLVAGGMPEATATLLQEGVVTRKIQDIQAQIVNSILQDAKKYNPQYGVQIDLIVSRIFASPSRRISLRKLNPEEPYAVTRRLIEYIKSAFVIFNAYPTVNMQPPLTVQPKVQPKYFAVDIGLALNFMGISAKVLESITTNRPLSELISEDAQEMLAEQYVAQALVKTVNKKYLPTVPRLFYWTKLKSSAEIDLVFIRETGDLNAAGKYVAIEVKSGKAGRLKSLVSFVETLTKRRIGLQDYEFIRFWDNPPKLEVLEHKVNGGKNVSKVRVKLHSLPIYLAELVGNT